MTVDRLHVHYAVDRLAPVEAASWIGVAAGALGHAAERSLVDAMSWVLGGATSAVETSVGSVFDRVLEVGADLRVLTPREARALPPMTPTGRVLVHEALNAGRYVVIPTSPVELGGEPRIGWWEYDPVSGQIVDRMDDGGHVTAAEWAALIKGIMIGVSCGMVALGFAVAAAGSMGQANTAGRDFIVGATAITTGFAGSGCVSAISFPL
jgi:hypothetical protein